MIYVKYTAKGVKYIYKELHSLRYISKLNLKPKTYPPDFLPHMTTKSLLYNRLHNNL